MPAIEVFTKGKELMNKFILQKKCDRYWPKEESETYGAFEATLTREEVMANYTVRNIRLKQTKVNLQTFSLRDRS